MNLPEAYDVDAGALTRLLYLPHFEFPEHGEVDWPLIWYDPRAARWVTFAREVPDDGEE